jgi:hypothetical protein
MFEVTTKAGKTYEVEAETIEGAARHHAKTACGSRNYASAGEPFHVWEPPATR